MVPCLPQPTIWLISVITPQFLISLVMADHYLKKVYLGEFKSTDTGWPNIHKLFHYLKKKNLESMRISLHVDLNSHTYLIILQHWKVRPLTRWTNNHIQTTGKTTGWKPSSCLCQKTFHIFLKMQFGWWTGQIWMQKSATHNKYHPLFKNVVRWEALPYECVSKSSWGPLTALTRRRCEMTDCSSSL